MRMVDEVVVGEGLEHGLDFKEHFLRIKPHILVVTEDDKYGDIKRELCTQVGAKYVVLPKDLDYTPISTTQILANIRAPSRCPLRVDFGGGWLDVPKLARPGAYIVNCAVSPLVSLGGAGSKEWPYHIGGGLGGSAAHALLSGKDSVQSELDLGVGWQVCLLCLWYCCGLLAVHIVWLMCVGWLMLLHKACSLLSCRLQLESLQQPAHGYAEVLQQGFLRQLATLGQNQLTEH
eukprot:GHUV01043857.1.p1 GENE.GHUV01043857.1~~GHUV01043857.1.p1  ORF type:complete len:233 (+),score=40.39 GHUV01043857.1:930-1628(+)